VLSDPRVSSSKSYADASQDETKMSIEPFGAYYITSISNGGRGKEADNFLRRISKDMGNTSGLGTFTLVIHLSRRLQYITICLIFFSKILDKPVTYH
jgi:hypothetical protein